MTNLMSGCFKIILGLSFVSEAQTNQIIYTDSLVNGWQDYSYCTRNLTNTSPTHSGTYSISATITSAYGSIQLYHAPFTNTGFGSVSFWINGGTNGGQLLQMYGNLGT